MPALLRLLTLTFLLLSSTGAWAQHSALVPHWTKPGEVLRVERDMHVRLITKDKRDLKGTVQRISKEQIVLESDSVQVEQVAFARSYKHDLATRRWHRGLLILLSPVLLALAALVLFIIVVVLALIVIIFSGEKIFGP